MHGRVAPVVALAVGWMTGALPTAAAAADRPIPALDAGALRAATAARHRDDDGPPASLVAVRGRDRSRDASAYGIIVEDRGGSIVVVTAAHVAALAGIVLVSTAGERLRVREGASVAGHDLALLIVDRPWRRFTVARVAPPPAPGARVHLWGVGRDGSTAPLSAVVRPFDGRPAGAPAGTFALDCPSCAHGDSGTGVFDERGELVGIVTAGYFSGTTQIQVLSERDPAWPGTTG